MQHILRWKGIEYESMEHCTVTIDQAVRIYATIIGHYQGQRYRVQYEIRLDATWQTQSARIEYQINERTEMIRLDRSTDHWELNGTHAPHFDHCIDIDIPLTPATNSLPIRRLQLQPGQEALIDVIYLDLLADKFTAVKQLYRRVSDNTYHYENVPNDFEADIKVDQNGFVREYPALFTRVDLR